ncbi:Mobile element protein [Richelia intracellularis]|nr:Mobile element protein [Richelia intracellularis]
MDGLYIIISTSLDEETLSATDTVKAEKNLSQVEQAFRSYKTVDLKVRLIYQYTAERVKARVRASQILLKSGLRGLIMLG